MECGPDPSRQASTAQAYKSRLAPHKETTLIGKPGLANLNDDEKNKYRISHSDDISGDHAVIATRSQQHIESTRVRIDTDIPRPGPHSHHD